MDYTNAEIENLASAAASTSERGRRPTIGAYFTRLTRQERRNLEVCHTCGAAIVATYWEDHTRTHSDLNERNA